MAMTNGHEVLPLQLQPQWALGHSVELLHPAIENPTRWRAMHKPVFDRYGHFCLYRNRLGIMCGRADGEAFWRIHHWRGIPYPWRHITVLELDHVTPVSVDYEQRWSQANCQPLCREHNRGEGIGKWTRTADYRPEHYPAAMRMCGALCAQLLSVLPFTRYGSPAYRARCRYAATGPHGDLPAD